MALTKDKIKRWYLILALIHLIVTTCCFFMFSQEPILEKFGFLFVANLMFHICYGMTFILRWQYKNMLSIGRGRNFVLFGAKMFSIAMLVVGPIFSSLILVSSILENKIENAIIFFAPMGLFIGGIGMWRFIRDELENK